MKFGVPQWILLVDAFVAKPKSISFTAGMLSLKEIRILSVLISRWASPKECRYSNPLRTYFMMKMRIERSLNLKDMCLKYYWSVIDSSICSKNIWIYINAIKYLAFVFKCAVKFCNVRMVEWWKDLNFFKNSVFAPWLY